MCGGEREGEEETERQGRGPFLKISHYEIIFVYIYALDTTTSNNYILELCADELVVGGGVGWSYDRRQPAAAARRAFFIGGGGVALWSAAAASTA